MSKTKKDIKNKEVKDNIQEEKVENKNEDLFFAKFNKSCLITYIGILFGILSMWFASSISDMTYEWAVKWSLVCLIVAGICDMFDGKFARMCKRTEEEKEFGVQLDSLADTICFIVAPIVLMLCMGFIRWYAMVIYVVFAICGISRLGYFNIKADLDTAVKTYSGLPVTSTAIIYPVLALIHSKCLTKAGLESVYLVTTFLVAMAMVLNIKIPKLKGKAYIITPIIAIIGIILILVK